MPYYSPIAVDNWFFNRLDIFVVGPGNRMYHKAWNGTSWDPDTTDWEDLGGDCSSNPAVVGWAPGRLDAFVRGPGYRLYHKAWDGTAWQPGITDWEDLGGECTSNPAVASWGPNRLDIFVLGANNHMYHKAWDGTAWQPGITDWEDLGGECNSDPAVVAWGPNRLDVFVRGPGLRLYHKAWDGAAWYPGITDWEDLGGLCTSEPAVASWGPNRLDVFVRGPGLHLHHKAWDGAAWQPGITDWEDLGGECQLDPAVAAQGNRLDVFTVGPGNHLFRKAWDGAAWQPGITEWEDLGGNCTSGPTAIAWGRRPVDVFVRGPENRLYYKGWDMTNWLPSITDWEDLGGNLIRGFDPARVEPDLPRRLQFRLRYFIESASTDGAGGGDADETYISGIGADSAAVFMGPDGKADPELIHSGTVGGPDDGVKELRAGWRTNPHVLVDFDLRRKAEWPRSFSATLIFVEEDSGDLGTTFEKAEKEVDKEIKDLIHQGAEAAVGALMTTLGAGALVPIVGPVLSNALGGLASEGFDAIFRAIVAGLNNDVFAPRVLTLEVADPFTIRQHPGIGQPQTLDIAEHGARYTLEYDWHLVE